MKQMLKLGLVLAAFAGVACVALALVNQVTAPAIEKVQLAKTNAGMIEVFPEANNFVEVTDFTPSSSRVTIDKMFIAEENKTPVGIVVQASGPTYDRATMLIGINSDYKITGVRFLSLSDTPGFGQKAAEPTFYNQFNGKNADSNFEAGKDMDGISGATITTDGISAIMREATKAAINYYSENYGSSLSNKEAGK